MCKLSCQAFGAFTGTPSLIIVAVLVLNEGIENFNLGVDQEPCNKMSEDLSEITCNPIVLMVRAFQRSAGIKEPRQLDFIYAFT